MNAVGLNDREENLSALRDSNGDVDAAIRNIFDKRQ